MKWSNGAGVTGGQIALALLAFAILLAILFAAPGGTW